LERRRAVDAKLIEALAGHPEASVARLGELAGLTESGASARLGKLAAKGLAASPMCIPGRAWALTEEGRRHAGDHVVLDQRDHDILAALALTAMGAMKLARRVEVCPMTIRRRVRSLVENGLVFADPRRFYAVTDAGRQALGGAVPPRWVDLDRLRASLAKDVQARSPTNDRTAAQLAAHARMARGRPRGGKQALMRAMAV
jgi:DNA-binding Lrp family transcriptional regulator